MAYGCPSSDATRPFRNRDRGRRAARVGDLGRLRTRCPHRGSSHRRGTDDTAQRDGRRARLTFVDAYATVLYVMGLDGLGWIDAHEGFGAYAITAEAMTYSTPTFDRYRADGDVAA